MTNDLLNRDTTLALYKKVSTAGSAVYWNIIMKYSFEKNSLHGGSSKSQKLTIPESFLHSIQSRCTRLKPIHFFNCALDHHFAPLRKLPLTIEIVDLLGVDWINLPRKDLRLGSLSSPFFKLKKRYKDLKSVQVSEEFGRYWLTPSDHRCLLEINQNKKFQRVCTKISFFHSV